MKKLLIFLFLSASLQIEIREYGISFIPEFFASAQHMYRESTDNCLAGGQWYRVDYDSVCTGNVRSDLRCDYCGLYFWSKSERDSHQKTCKYRPWIKFKYDDAGNRTERNSQYFHWGNRVTAYNQSGPSGHTLGASRELNLAAVILRRKKSGDDSREEIA